jgi:hypothetical protein
VSTETAPSPGGGRLRAGLFGLLVLAAMSAYYAIFFLPPRLVGGNDPDRYYHLGLSALIGQQGLLRVVPQVEDLGWGRYFPDKEFLFHAATGFAHWLAGPDGVMLVVPLAGLATAFVLYRGLLRVLSPGRAAAWLLAAFLLSPVLLFRMTMLRPHLFAVLFFCLLVVALLRGRGWLAALAAAGFALSYHALYMPLIAIGLACLLPMHEGRRWRGAAVWALAGLVCGTVLNPYFPSTLVMSWLHLKLALGIGAAPGLRSGEEVQPISLLESVFYFGFLLVALAGAAILLWRRRLAPTRENAGLWFLFLLSLAFTALSLKNSRATEYATPCGLLLVGYCLARIDEDRRDRWLLGAIGTLALVQGPASFIYYQDCWLRPQGGDTPAYLAAVQLLPPEAAGKKVFNCQWEAGSYLLFARPDLRFVDLLEPAMLWNADPGKYVLRLRLIYGLEPDPRRVLREVFHADYVLCGTPAMNAQMAADPRHFEQIVGTEPMNSLRVYKVVD